MLSSSAARPADRTAGRPFPLLACLLLAVRCLLIHRVIEALLDAGALLIDDVVQLLLDVFEDGAHVVAGEFLLAHLLEALHHVAHAGHAAIAEVRAALHDPLQCAAQIAVLDHVVGDRLQEIVGIERVDVLRAVPVAIANNHVRYPLPS